MTTGPIRANGHHAASHAHRAATGSGPAVTSFDSMLEKHAGLAPADASEKGAYSAGKGERAAAEPASCPVSGNLNRFVGQSTGSGQCVALVQAAHPALGSTAHWVRGEKVQGNTDLQPGTPIATFSASGRYANATDGSSHAAIYLGQTAHGVQVLDQWAGKPASVRTIPWSRPGAAAANIGAAFHVVRSA